MSADQLEEMSDAELSEAFAVEVAGWQDFGEQSRAWGCRTGFPPVGAMQPCPPFSTSTDAVLPWLEKHRYITAATFIPKRKEWVIGIGGDEAVGATFARAATICLLRATRNQTKVTK